MIERLQRALEHVDEVPPDVQEEIAALIEARVELAETETRTKWHQSDTGEPGLPRTVRDALAVMGVWRDLQNDDEFAALDRIRHENTPAPRVERDEL